jgi:polysaccharide export outer membrane protein
MKKLEDFKFFIVDDVEMCLETTKMHLTNLGFQNIKTYNSGHVCLNDLVEKPDIIFLDHEMPEITGIEVLKRIKRFDPDIFVVVVSGQDTVQVAIDFLKFGAFDYIIKNGNEGKAIEIVMSKIVAVMKLMDNQQKGFLKKIFS